uniref:Peptidase S1 domain-containing protein n=1 Tax=Leptobrachium leishanense TaxID=445787 RepID=A0A8C5PTS2_9ANUR
MISWKCFILCFSPSYPSYYTISLGMYRLGGSNPHGVTVKVEQIIKNPLYINTRDRGDITLVKLKNPVTFNNYIQPICLPDASISFSSGMECWVTGWGTRSSGGSLPSLNTLQEVMTPLIDYRECDQMYHIGASISSSITIIQSEKICSGYKEGGKDSCQGDSGGPLVCKMNGVWIQAGIVSWGYKCALAYFPGVYTLVPAYQSWIKLYVPEMTFSTLPTTLRTVSPTLSRLPACGVPVVSGRIVGGEDAVDGEWPWQVAVNYDGDFICGGSLISEQWVMGAAHCFKYPSIPSYYTISLGMYRLGGSNPHGVTVEVEQIIKNSQYTYTGDRGDITLVKLKNPVNFTDYIQPICLPDASVTLMTGMECWVTGWGNRSSEESFPYLNTLHEAMTPLIDYKQCDQMYHVNSSTNSSDTIIQEEMICAG